MAFVANEFPIAVTSSNFSDLKASSLSLGFLSPLLHRSSSVSGGLRNAFSPDKILVESAISVILMRNAGHKSLEVDSGSMPH